MTDVSSWFLILGWASLLVLLIVWQTRRSRVPILSAAMYLERGLHNLMRGDEFDALIDFNQVIKMRPDLAEPYMWRGRVWHHKRRIKQALHDYSRAIQLKPDYVLAYLDRAQAYQDHHEYNQAIADYDHVLRIGSSDIGQLVDAYVGRSHCYQVQGDYRKADTDLAHAYTLDPQANTSYQLRVHMYIAKHQTCGVPTGLRSAIQYNAKDAIQSYTMAITANPEAAGAYLERAIAYTAIQDVVAARADLDKAIQIQPDLALAYQERGQSYGYPMQSDVLDYALADFNHAIQLDPSDALSYYYRGELYNWKVSFVKAQDTPVWHDYQQRSLADYDRAIQLSSMVATFYFSRGQLHHKLGNVDQAIEDLTHAIELSPAWAEAYYLRGQLYRLRGNRVAAIADYQKVVELNHNQDLRESAEEELQVLISHVV